MCLWFEQIYNGTVFKLSIQGYRSSVPVPIHVIPAEEPGYFSPDLVEASVSGVVVPNHVPMCPVAEGSVCRVLTIAKLVVAAFGHVELNWPESRSVPVACAVTERVGLAESARAPVVNLSLLQVGIVREVSCIATSIPAIKGNEGGRYLPSMYWNDSGIGTVL